MILSMLCNQLAFFWPFMKSIELIGAICLLSNRAPASGLALLIPIMAIVVLFHIFLNPQGLPLAAIVIVLGAVLMYAYQNNFKALLHAIKTAEA